MYVDLLQLQPWMIFIEKSRGGRNGRPASPKRQANGRHGLTGGIIIVRTRNFLSARRIKAVVSAPLFVTGLQSPPSPSTSSYRSHIAPPRLQTMEFINDIISSLGLVSIEEDLPIDADGNAGSGGGCVIA